MYSGWIRSGSNDFLALTCFVMYSSCPFIVAALVSLYIHVFISLVNHHYPILLANYQVRQAQPFREIYS